MLHYPALEGVLVCCYHHYAEPHIQGFLHRLASLETCEFAAFVAYSS